MARDISRRSFMTLFGCGVVGLAADWSGVLPGFQLASSPRGTALMYDFLLTSEAGGRYQWQRSAGEVLFTAALAPESCYRWRACDMAGIVLREGEYLTVRNLDDPTQQDVDWQMIWRAATPCQTVTGCEYCGTAYLIWPADGECTSCGGRLPAPLPIQLGQDYLTKIENGQRTIIPMRG